MIEGTPAANLWPPRAWAHMCACIHPRICACAHKSELKPREIIRRHMSAGAPRNHLDVLKSTFRQPEFIGNLENWTKCLDTLSVSLRASTLIVVRDKRENFSQVI